MKDVPHHQQALVAAFFTALQQRSLNDCRDILAQLAAIGPDSADWHTYLCGILAFEADHDWARAEESFRHVAVMSTAPLVRARARLALGRSLDVQGRWDEAIAAFADAHTSYTALALPLEQAKALKHLAITINNGFGKGDYGPDVLAQAARYALDGLELLAEPNRADPEATRLEGSIWNTLGLIRRNTGELDEAVTCYKRDLAICEANTDRYGMGLTYGNLGEVYQLRGRAFWPAAQEAYQKALAIIREFDEVYEEAEVLANMGFLYRTMGRLDEALDHFDQAVVLIEGVRARVSSTSARSSYFGTVVDTYAYAVLCAWEAGYHDRAFGYAERARARAYLDLLASESITPQPAANPADIETVTMALPADAILLAYFTCGLIETSEDHPYPGVQRHRLPPPRTLLFAITRETMLVRDLGLDPAVLCPSSLDAVVERHFLDPAICRTLYTKLIAPVEHLIEGRRQIFLVPHGPLHYIPFPALVANSGETVLRIGGPELVFGPSATVLFATAPVTHSRRERSCLAIGYNGTGQSRLRFAEGEARSVVQKIGGDTLVGDGQKLATVIAEADNYRWLHLSCHGIFHPDRPLASGLQISASEMLTAAVVAERLRLSCDVAVLSACESGLSRVRRGDELVGMVTSFLTAGAGAVLCSLWQVDELSTRILFEAFYERLIAGESPAQALAQAQLFLRGLTRSQVETLTQSLVARDLLPGLFSRAGDLVTERVHSIPISNDISIDDMPYADPSFWAPFILVSGARSGDRE